MSYDLYLFKPESGVDPLATAIALLDQEEQAGEINPGQPHPDFEHRKQQLATMLMQHNPALSIFRFGFGHIAAIEGSSEAEARIRYRHLELNGLDNGNGIQITLFDTTASITIPYWHHTQAAHQTFQEVWRYLSLLEREAGFRAYDPQLDKVLDLASDFAVVVTQYGKGVAQVDQLR